MRYIGKEKAISLLFPIPSRPSWALSLVGFRPWIGLTCWMHSSANVPGNEISNSTFSTLEMIRPWCPNASKIFVRLWQLGLISSGHWSSSLVGTRKSRSESRATDHNFFFAFWHFQLVCLSVLSFRYEALQRVSNHMSSHTTPKTHDDDSRFSTALPLLFRPSSKYFSTQSASVVFNYPHQTQYRWIYERSVRTISASYWRFGYHNQTPSFRRGKLSHKA